MTFCAQWIFPDFDLEVLPFVFVSEDAKKKFALCNIDDHFPAFRGQKLPMLAVEDPQLIYRYKSRASLIKSLCEQEIFVRSWCGSCLSDPDQSNGQDVAFWENALHNQASLSLHYDAQTDQYRVPLSYGSAEMRPDVENINCTVVLKRQEKDCAKNQLTLQCIEWCQGTSTPKSPDWQKAVAVATCSLLTFTTFVEHFLSSHLITVGAINALAHTYLFKSHPIGMLIHMHSIGIHHTNVFKGHPLLNENFMQDFSLSPKGLVDFIGKTTEEYDLTLSDPRSRYLHQGHSLDDLDKHPYWKDLILYYDLFYQYVKEWVLVSYTSFDELQADKPLLCFWNKMREYSFFKNIGSLSQKRLIKMLACFVWVSIYKHEQVGDNMDGLLTAARMFVPKDAADKDAVWRQRAAKNFFNFVIVVATRTPAVKLLSSEWVHSLPERYQPIAKRMQDQVRQQGRLDLELGTNK